MHIYAHIDERRAVRISRNVWNTKVSALIGTAILSKYHELLKKESYDAMQ